MNNTQQRFLSAGTGILGTVCIIFLPFWRGLPSLILGIWGSIQMLTEMDNMARAQGGRFYLWETAFAALANFMLLFVYTISPRMLPVLLLGAVCVFLGYFYFIFAREVISGQFASVDAIGFSLLGYILHAFCLPWLFYLKSLALGGQYLGVLLAVVWVSDASALLIGKAFGKHVQPLSFLASPHKTIPGYLGAFLGGMVAILICYFIQGWIQLPTHYTLMEWLILGVAVTFAASLGDLIESAIKRWYGVKDSGNLMPGIGGLFDAMDSVIVATPVFALLLYWFQ